MYLLQGYITAQFGSFNYFNSQDKEEKLKTYDVTKLKETSIISIVTLFQARTLINLHRKF